MDKALIFDSMQRWSNSYVSSRAAIIPRSDPPDIPDKNIGLALSGLRRVGKTSMAIQVSSSLPAEQVLYYNFEDPLFLHSEKPEEMEDLMTVYRREHGSEPELVILDEVQNVAGWERWVRTLIDQKRTRVIVTGSNAKLLSAELSSSLTGRVLEHRTWPLSLNEVKRFIKSSGKKRLSVDYLIKQVLRWGALPGVLLQENEEKRDRLLRQYLSDIVHRDIINRYKIRNKKNLDRILIYYQTNLSSLHSYTAIKKAFSIPSDTVADYTQALADAFLLFEVERFHKNLKTQARDPRKVYVADFGLRRVGARSPEADVGKLLENWVFLELKRLGHEIFYFREAQEVDFVVTESYSPTLAIQVCAYGMDQPATRKREVSALLECLEFCELDEGLIVTMDRNEEIRTQGKTIRCVSLAKWLS